MLWAVPRALHGEVESNQRLSGAMTIAVTPPCAPNRAGRGQNDDGSQNEPVARGELLDKASPAMAAQGSGVMGLVLMTLQSGLCALAGEPTDDRLRSSGCLVGAAVGVPASIGVRACEQHTAGSPPRYGALKASHAFPVKAATASSAEKGGGALLIHAVSLRLGGLWQGDAGGAGQEVRGVICRPAL